jgi:DNA-binding NarL/FixJ family response regulator
MPGKPYSLDEIEIIIRGAEARLSNDEIAKRLNRSSNAIKLQRRDMCLNMEEAS